MDRPPDRSTRRSAQMTACPGRRQPRVDGEGDDAAHHVVLVVGLGLDAVQEALMGLEGVELVDDPELGGSGDGGEPAGPDGPVQVGEGLEPVHLGPLGQRDLGLSVGHVELPKLDVGAEGVVFGVELAEDRRVLMNRERFSMTRPPPSRSARGPDLLLGRHCGPDRVPLAEHERRGAVGGLLLEVADVVEHAGEVIVRRDHLVHRGLDDAVDAFEGLDVVGGQIPVPSGDAIQTPRMIEVMRTFSLLSCRRFETGYGRVTATPTPGDHGVWMV